jgi:arginine deiminase
MYNRNPLTAEELASAGFRVLAAEQLLADPSIDLLDGGKYVILLESSELSRARGGPRCMTMPLARVR